MELGLTVCLSDCLCLSPCLSLCPCLSISLYISVCLRVCLGEKNIDCRWKNGCQNTSSSSGMNCGRLTSSDRMTVAFLIQLFRTSQRHYVRYETYSLHEERRLPERETERATDRERENQRYKVVHTQRQRQTQRYRETERDIQL